MNKDLQVGQRVKLSPSTRWSIRDTNPLDCEGTVARNLYKGWTRVNWDNGFDNSYLLNDDDLIPLD